jgi:FkbH-like protein
VPFAEIARVLDMTKPYEIEIVPNGCENMTLYFGLMDFVKERPAAAPIVTATAPEKILKCIVWDLDNTLWDGVLIEDGPAGVRLRPHVVEVIRTLDERGILHSIASKNNRDDVLPVLEQLGLTDYFLYPQIAWTPKSESIRGIARRLNFGIDSIAFVDDQPFEREEVKSSLSQVTVIDAAEYFTLLSRPECQAPVTAESRKRRQMYHEQQEREAVADAYAGDYFGFLRACEMEVIIRPLSEDNLRRVYELAQRTNQMNFSGNRYSEDELRAILASPQLRGCVIHCRDRFGDYGIVGFAVVDTEKPCLADLMFSCRVQAKRVEHAVLAFLLRQFGAHPATDFNARYRKTERNAPSGKVFEEVGFEEVEENNGVWLLAFPAGREIPDDGIVHFQNELEEKASVSSQCVDQSA